MLKRFWCVALVALLAAPAAAELCTIDAVPAATLLLPYFEVNLKKRSKAEETLFSINNAAAMPTIAHVVFWTDMSLPTLAFDVFLTGFDVQEISLLDLFFDGRLPGSISNVVGLTDLGDFQDAHSGRSVDGECYGQRLAGTVARGYVTIDNVQQDGLVFPNDPDYFSSGSINDVNQLWGEYFVFNKKYIEQERLISIEAGDFSGFTFYNRFTSSGSDRREPLGDTWAARWFGGTTHLMVWRDSSVSVEPFSCGDLESTGAYPLDTVELVVWDDQEDATAIMGQLPFPAETQLVKVGSSKLPTFGYEQGWIFLDLGLPSGTFSQSFVTVRQDFRKRRSRSMAQLLVHAAHTGNGDTPPPVRRGRR